MAMSALIKSLEDIMRKDAGLNGDAQYIEQITWLLFLKAFDAKEMEWELRPGYRGVIPEGFRWRDWAADPEGITGDPLMAFVERLFATLKKLDVSDGDPRKFVVRNVFEDVNNYMKSGVYLRQLVNRIDEKVDFIDATQKHTFNDLYEGMLKDLQSAGRAGEFYTPRAVTNFIVKMVDPKLGETVLDPACGTGGFLTSALAHFGNMKTTAELAELQRSINGWEKKPLPYLLAMTNLLLHDIEVPRIRHQNSLARPLSDYSARDRVDVIITNPPFGGAEDAAIKRNFPSDVQTSETADLFMALVMNLLKDHGRCGIVLPDGFMFGDGVKATLKEKLLKEYGLHTVIRLPQVFKPYANVDTNLLFFQKGVPSRGVWFYRLDLPEGVKNFTKTKPMEDRHFDPVREWLADKRPLSVDGFDKARFFSVEELEALHYDFDKCCPFPRKEEEILEPDALIARFQAERRAWNEGLDCILANITSCLQGDEIKGYAQGHTRLVALRAGFQDALRKSILQQAIQGKLTKRNPADEPASELLKRIRAEKAHRIKEGKIKKEKPLAPVSEDEKPFEIPENWSWVRLGEVALIERGAGIKRFETAPTGVPCVRYGEIYTTYGYSFTATKSFVPERIASSCHMANQGDVLCTLTGEWKEEIAKATAYLGKAPIAIGGDLAKITSATFHPVLLVYFFFSPFMIQQKAANANGTMIVHIGKNAIRNLLIPLPPLAEQERIVARINELLAMCDDLKAVSNHTES